jgi:4-hydroxy-2-oxoheptanedioate aldolase
MPAAGSQTEVQLGAWAVVPTALTAEMLSRAGFDYVCIDMQHGLADLADAFSMLQAIDLGTATPIVRVPWNEPAAIGRVLDAGALGVIVPMVNTRAEAQAAVKSCLYPPEGGRSAGPTRVGLRDGPDYMGTANERVSCIPMIETTEAVANLDDILSVDGVDRVYVGPSDLSVSLGLGPGNHDGEAPFDDALAAIVEGCSRHGVVPGIHANSELGERRIEQGFAMVTVAVDFSMLRAAAEGALRAVRK